MYKRLCATLVHKKVCPAEYNIQQELRLYKDCSLFSPHGRKKHVKYHEVKIDLIAYRTVHHLTDSNKVKSLLLTA